MGELTFALLGEACSRYPPGVLLPLAADDADAEPVLERAIQDGALIVARRLRVLDGRRADGPRRGCARLRRARDENAGQEVTVDRRRQLQIDDLVELALVAQGRPAGRE